MVSTKWADGQFIPVCVTTKEPKPIPELTRIGDGQTRDIETDQRLNTQVAEDQFSNGDSVITCWLFKVRLYIILVVPLDCHLNGVEVPCRRV